MVQLSKQPPDHSVNQTGPNPSWVLILFVMTVCTSQVLPESPLLLALEHQLRLGGLGEGEGLGAGEEMMVARSLISDKAIMQLSRSLFRSLSRSLVIAMVKKPRHARAWSL